MTHLHLLLRCPSCPTRFVVLSDDYLEYKFWAMIARVDLANHVTEHNVERIIERMRSYDKTSSNN